MKNANTIISKGRQPVGEGHFSNGVSKRPKCTKSAFDLYLLVAFCDKVRKDVRRKTKDVSEPGGSRAGGQASFRKRELCTSQRFMIRKHLCNIFQSNLQLVVSCRMCRCLREINVTFGCSLRSINRYTSYNPKFWPHI